MGLDKCAVQFLLAAKVAGVSFKHTAMIGRQVFVGDVTPRWFQNILDRHGIKADASRILGAEGRYTEDFWRLLGAETVTSFDASTYEGSTVVHDLNMPIENSHKGRFTMVIDGGTIEHVFDPKRAVQNCMEMLSQGGHFLGVMAGNSLLGHGFYQFSPEWAYRVFSAENGFRVRSVMLCEIGFYSPRFYRVDDPAYVRGRVELASKVPTYLVVLAQREKEIAVFEKIPQQSDYTVAWNSSADIATVRGDCDESKTSLPTTESSVSSSRLPEWIRWNSPLRRGVRSLGRIPRFILSHKIPQLYQNCKSLLRRPFQPYRLSWVQNHVGLRAPYYHHLSDVDLLAGRITNESNP